MSSGDNIPNILQPGQTIRNVEATTLVQSSGALYATNGTFWVSSTGYFSVNYHLGNNHLLFRHGGSDVVTITAHVYYTKDSD